VLPIDHVLPELVSAVRQHRSCVLVAPPGAGKTTRVPGALLDAGIVSGSIVVLQPRRLAARLAAARIASERNVPLGGEVGYQVRFDRKTSAATRIELVTEGVLTRRLLSDPELKGVGCVVIDEFHERHLDGDLALAMVERLRARRPELALIVMSATLDAEPVAAFLGDAPIVRSEGRTFPLTIEHADAPDDRQLGKQVASAVRRACQQGLDGDVLVFLPGTAEIRRCADDLEDAARVFDLHVVPLHGDLTADEQDVAVRPSTRRKVILATNVAETSVTIEGVTCVIDSGLARIARHSPWSGIPSLEIEPVSRASCAQRAGRAGRTRPGRVIRLYTKHDHDTRRAFELPEIQRSELSGAALELHGAGLAGLDALRWFEPPPEAAARAAEELLARLGAIDAGRRITSLGRGMLRFPVHPRVGRLLCEAEQRGVAREACVIGGLLGQRELRLERRGRGAEAKLSSPSDLIDDLDVMLSGRKDGVDRGTAYAVDRAAKQLERIVDTRRRGPQSDDDVDRELQICILTAYPDRVGKRRARNSADIVFAGGGSGVLAPSSSVNEPELVVAVDVSETGGRGQSSRVQIRRASGIEAAWLLDLYLDRIAEVDELLWNADKQRVERVTQMTYDGLPIDESRLPAGNAHGAAALLAKQALAAGIEKLVDRDALAQWRARVALVARTFPDSGIPEPNDAALADVIARACEGASSFAELRSMGLLELLDASLGDKRTFVDRMAPTHLSLPRRKRAPITYELDQPPHLASRMQDFFGLSRAPSVCDGRVPLVLHLLAPNQRPVQVTSDLPGFWVRHYPDLRRQLMRRYPRHQWPEDPTQLIAGDD
jgi:ATP-dependent helicase HrpB